MLDSENSESVNDDLRQWEEVKIEMPWGHVSGKWYGNRNEQPILAFHGWLDNAGTFDRLIPLLPEKIPVFSIDLPGHGQSDHFPTGMNYHLYWDYISVVRRIVKHFGWQKLKMIGHSMGASVCFMYAACYAKDVEQIILLDSYGPIIRNQRINAAITGSFIDRTINLDSTSKQHQWTYEEVIERRLEEGSIDRESVKILLKRGLNPVSACSGEQKYTVAADPRLRYSGLGLFTLEHILTYAALIQCPVLNIRATPGYKFDRPEVYQQVLNVLRNNVDVEYHEVAGSHYLHLQTPEKIANLISMFLLNVDQF
uniref:probable serine hydrolase n=2 Tax=Sitodiplosis mosellana TaxID=263140 RepID=UPI0024441991|nr:probable serine hydrolase [Sitodiplosis mosellana]